MRLYGCNLDCSFCDTRLSAYTEYDPDELLEEIKGFPGDYHSVSFTGGEPLLQKNFLKEVLRLSHQAGFRNYLETNGTLYEELKEVIDLVDIVAMDIKLPSSTGMSCCWRAHRKFLEVASAKEVFVKAVICEESSKRDFLESLRIMENAGKDAVLVLQPNSFQRGEALNGKLEFLKELSIQAGVTSCVIPQLHKIAGVR